MNWIHYALIAIVVVGFSDLFRKLASHLANPFFSNLIFQGASFLTAVMMFLLFRGKIEYNPRDMSFALFGGMLISVFTMLSFKVLEIGPGVSTVMPVLRIGGITLIVLLGVFFLKEQLSIQKMAGLVLSFIGVYLLFSK